MLKKYNHNNYLDLSIYKPRNIIQFLEEYSTARLLIFAIWMYKNNKITNFKYMYKEKFNEVVTSTN